MKKSLISVALLMVAVVLLNSGCASYMVYKNSKRNVALLRAIASGDEPAIKAIQLGDDGVGVGINVTALDTIKENPLGQAGAAILDAVVIYGIKEGVEYLNEKDDDDRNTSGDANGTGDITVNVDNSDDTDINVEVSIENDSTVNTDSGDGDHR